MRENYQSRNFLNSKSRNLEAREKNPFYSTRKFPAREKKPGVQYVGFYQAPNLLFFYFFTKKTSQQGRFYVVDT